jgi:hypothetical protein
MLAALAAAALVVGSIGVTMSVTEQQATEQAHQAVVEVQAVESADAGTE